MSYSVNFDSNEVESYMSDYAIVGSGIAGLNAAYLAKDYGEVFLLTKDRLSHSSSSLAQGGIACVISQVDSFQSHIEDTVYAGAGLCDREAVEVLVKEAPLNIKSLIDLGVNFDKKDGQLELGREGAHSANRIIHAGDYTGREIINGLISVLDGVKIFEDTLVLDLLVKDNMVKGVLAKNLVSNQFFIVWAKVVVLATGGAGNLFLNTTNPDTSTGDGISLAARQGALLKDMEFMQFHPTALHGKDGERFLITEAIRGEGGILRNEKGVRFMPFYHELKELAPRDVVSRAILSEIRKSKIDYVYLDVSNIDKSLFKRRFPSIFEKIEKMGIDIEKDYIPVSPAAHYYMGGIATDLNGETTIKGLYACGECACTGVQGANRLASNSLLEGLVFSTRAVSDSKKYLNNKIVPSHFYNYDKIDREIDANKLRHELQHLMEANVGIIRSESSLKTMLNWLKLHEDILYMNADDRAKSELLSLYILSKYMTISALLRKESRGSHFRTDYPEENEMYRRHILIKGDEIYFDGQDYSTKIDR